MAKTKHSAPARPAKAPGKPTNPLGRPYWVLELADEASSKVSLPNAHGLATCATLTQGVHALIRLFCNSQAFGELQASSSGTDPHQTPLSPSLTEGLLATLYMTSKEAEEVSMGLLEEALERRAQ